MANVENRVLLYAPTARDAQTASQLLDREGLSCLVCHSIAEICQQVSGGAGVIVIPEEAAARDARNLLAGVLKGQPPWSDLPVIVLTAAGQRQSAQVRNLLEAGNITLVRRPLDVTEFINAIRAALRDRRRQYQVRAHLTELARQAEALRDADRRKDEFLAMLAHELRNPLAPIRNGLQILNLAEGNRNLQARTREMIDRQVNHLGRLVDDLLDVSRITRGKVELRRERVDLRDVISRAVETIRPLIDSRQHTLTISTPDYPVWVWADLTRMTQVIGNLLNNSAKYSPSEGTIRLCLEEDGAEAVIHVCDSGVGIPKDMLPRVFELFTQIDRTLDRSQGGLGIGLTVVRSLVEMHGGTVVADSDGIGCGSTFSIRLPILQDSLPAIRATTPGADLSANSLRVLVVDDNVDAGESLGELLRLLGHEVQVTANGPLALELFDDFKPEVALLDIGLPGMNGYDLARQLRARQSSDSLLLIAVTGYGQEEDRRKSRMAGFDHHLTKPAEFSVLQVLLAQSRPAQFGCERTASTVEAR
jgi:signal transduction histidine kinase/ActR/RegA family two-component response regulator